MSVIFNQNKQEFNPDNKWEVPTYIFEGTREQYEQEKKNKKLKLAIDKDDKEANVFFIDPQVIRR